MLIRSNVLDDSDVRKQRFLSLLSQVGRAGLNALYPNDFEYYMCSFELVDSQGRTNELFVFPLMPTSIMQKEDKILNIEKSQGGITTTNTTTFEPIDIAISGSFGRRFRFMLENAVQDFSGVASSLKGQGVIAGTKQAITSFSKSIKTGYGCFKMLQSLFRKANALDENGNPYKLFFYNPAIGDNFMVRVTSFSGKQDINSNMIWNYDLKMVALAPAEGVRIEGSRIKNLGRMVGATVTNQAAEAIVGDLVNKIP